MIKNLPRKGLRRQVHIIRIVYIIILLTLVVTDGLIQPVQCSGEGENSKGALLSPEVLSHCVVQQVLQHSVVNMTTSHNWW